MQCANKQKPKLKPHIAFVFIRCYVALLKMEQWTPPMWGTLRISNPKTLKKWIHNGNFQKEIDDGYNFYAGCGRFRTEPCKCHKCRKGKGKKLQEVIDRHYKPNAT